MQSPRTILAGAVVALAVLASAAAPASAHSGGRVQLLVDRLGLHSTAGNDWTVSVTLVDADSGSPQPGFDVVAEGNDQAGHSAGPVPLADGGGGQYSGSLAAAPPGNWEIVVRAETLPGGVPGVPLRKAYPLVLQPGQDVAIGPPAAGRARSGGGMGLRLLVAVAAAVVVGLLILGRRRRPGLVPARRREAL
jgi:hypothetical protein